MKRLLTILALVCTFPIAGWGADFAVLTLADSITAADTAGTRAQTLMLDTTEAFHLRQGAEKADRFWVGFTLDNDTLLPSGARGDSLTIIIQHSPNGVDNWQFYDSTGKATLAQDAFFSLSNNSIKPDSVFTMEYVRFIYSYSDSVDWPEATFTNVYKTRIRPWIFPSK